MPTSSHGLLILFLALSGLSAAGLARAATPIPTPGPTSTPLPTPTSVPIPLPTIVPRVPNITPPAIIDTRGIICTEQATQVRGQQAAGGPPGLTRAVQNCRPAEAELAQTVNALFNRTDAIVVQDPNTGIMRVTVAELTFTVWPLGATQEVRSGLIRAQGPPTPPRTEIDPVTGRVTLISQDGIRNPLMAVPADFEAFLRLLGATAGDATTGNFFLTTTTPGLQLSARPSFQVSRGGGSESIVVNLDGTRTVTYSTGEQQDILPVFVDVTSFLGQLRQDFPQVQATANLDGTVTVRAGDQTVRVRPDFNVVGRSPSGSKRLLMDESGSPAFELADGRRQRFTIGP